MLTLRIATIEDIKVIAQLHTKSWQEHYRGVMSDHYLDNYILKERLATWTKRLTQPKNNQYIIIALYENKPCGFACVFGEHDAAFGALLDNLHITTMLHGKGFGKTLIKAAAQWSWENYPDQPFFLWVFEQNVKALQFYKNLGGVQHETKTEHNPDGSTAPIIRIVWTDVKKLLTN